MKLDNCITIYLGSKKYLAKKSYSAYRYTINEFKDFVFDNLHKILEISDVDRILCEDFLQNLLEKKLNPHTVNDRRGILCNFFNYCVDNEWITKNPVIKIKKIIEPDNISPNPLTIEQVDILLASLKCSRYYEIMAIVYYAGLRISEVTHLLNLSNL